MTSMPTASESLTEKMRKIKHLFMTYRNGIISDTLRKAGMPYGVIFGLQIPQISEIARIFASDAELARHLWEDKDVRESRLLACRLFPENTPSHDEALRMMLDVRTREEADYLAFALLRHRSYSADLIAAIEAMHLPEESLNLYAANALRRNIYN